MKSKVAFGPKALQAYPFLGVFDDGTVVLFISRRTGVCVSPVSPVHYVGYFSDEWAESDAVLLNGSVTLEND